MKYLKKFRVLIFGLLAYLTLVFFLYLVEAGAESANIHSFMDAIWYSIVTLTTVGYGDFFPVTSVGKIIGIAFVIGSLGLLGLLIGKAVERFNEIQEKRKMGLNGTDFSNHIVIIGWNDFSREVVKQLRNSDRRVAIVTEQKDQIDLIYGSFGKDDVFVLFSDWRDTSNFDKLNLEQASVVFVNLPNDTDNLIAMLNVKKVNSKVDFVVALESSDLRDTFFSAGCTHVLSKNAIAARLIASYTYEPDVAMFANDLITSTVYNEESEFDIQQYRITSSNPFANQTFGHAFHTLKQKHNVIAIGICKTQNGTRELIKVPQDDTVLEVGDYLILILNGKTEIEIVREFGIKEGV
ncbi:potassium channel family protein [Flavilitoribacter nigricans]|uniref:Ion transport 2 domain protein n=1 Tax=Flavilitoribacter nigricans (strain ATCC 23147 / DSM 23189 / NBRC 102662 / NCIMB 1420 / SS-2) TaxID=1122177 RepID=A0A2D0MWL0_FLAN2|nr:potassium channel protein [Flavilitoribacter nigricans]PHN00625.1 ion transport 2 domain protein [Flavilitoribacter nigricans DSM 23189 = NBRC 102662]